MEAKEYEVEFKTHGVNIEWIVTKGMTKRSAYALEEFIHENGGKARIVKITSCREFVS